MSEYPSPVGELDRRAGPADRRARLSARDGPWARKRPGGAASSEWPSPPDVWASTVAAWLRAVEVGDDAAALALLAEDVAWRVPGDPPIGGVRRGPGRVLAYQAERLARTGGTFRQRLLAIEGGGPVVSVSLRSEARRDGRTLAVPTMLVFELTGGRISGVHELPGDLPAWEAFWALDP